MPQLQRLLTEREGRPWDADIRVSTLRWRVRHRWQQFKRWARHQPSSVAIPVVEVDRTEEKPLTHARGIACATHGLLMQWSYPRPVSPEANLDGLFDMMKVHSACTIGWIAVEL